MTSNAASKPKKVTFEYETDPGREVYVAGSFNDWNATRTRLEEDPNHQGRYTAILSMPPGRHEYKFVVDGDWLIDASRPDQEANPFGSTNSVIDV